MRPQDLATAKTVAKISVVSNTAGGKKSVARRSTGLDYSSKQFRAVATRFDKLAVRYQATITVADIFIWLRARPDRSRRPWPIDHSVDRADR